LVNGGAASQILHCNATHHPCTTQHNDSHLSFSFGW
jgi:hypothetical protein